MKPHDELSNASILHRIRTALDLALNAGTHKEVVDPERTTRLRISSFPFCGIRWFMELPRTTSKSTRRPSSMKYFTQVGHVLHAVMQDGLDSLGEDLDVVGVSLIGNWKCSGCSRFAKMCKRPAQCKGCGKNLFSYREAEIDRGNIFGHIDTIFCLTLRKPTKAFPGGEIWIVVDYKTTSLKVVNATDCLLPYHNNMGQICAYVGQLKELGHPMLPMALLVYVPRDNPWRYRMEPVPVDFEAEAKKAALYVRRFKHVGSVKDQDGINEVIAIRPCRDKLLSQFKSCAFAESCAGPENTAKIERATGHVLARVIHKLPILKD